MENDMIQTQSGGSRPVPDPTILTTEAQERAERTIREWTEGQLAIRDERMARIELATKLRAEAVAKAIAHAQELAKKDDEHQAAMSNMRFTERDVRTAEAATQAATAVSAAFAAQKEAAQKQDENNQKSISKQEEATEKALVKLGDLFQTTFEALRDQVSDLKLRINGSEFAQRGVTEYRVENRSSANLWIAAAGFLVTLVALVVMAWSVSRSPDVSVVPDQSPTVTVTVPTGG